MDNLDRALLEAWARLTPEERERRRRVGRGAVLSRPNRAWCVAVRASDRRITKDTALIWPLDELVEGRERHWVDLDVEGVRRLVRPVWLDWPGVPADVAAGRLGKTRPAVHEWVKRGVLRVRYRDARSLGRRGKPVPVVWSERAIDPGWESGRGPDGVWGSLWHTFADRVGVGLKAERVPRGGRGWRWVCPGCGGEVDRLYLPMRVWGVGGWEDEKAHSGKWKAGTGRDGFACRGCLEVEDLTLVGGGKGWNLFVAYVSGGVLYGREVRRPREWREGSDGGVARKRAGLLNKERVRELTGLGWSRARVARELGVSERCVTRHTAELRRDEGVGSRRALMRRLGAPAEEPLSPRRREALGLWRAGLGYGEIAERMGVSVATARVTMWAARKELGLRAERRGRRAARTA